MDKSFLGIAGFAPLLSRFLRQKNSLRFGEKRKQGGSIRKPPFGFTVSKGFGRQYCMQSIPLAVLKLSSFSVRGTRASNCMQSIPLAVLKLHLRSARNPQRALLHAIHTACGIETLRLLCRKCAQTAHCMQSIPLAVLKLRREDSKQNEHDELHAIHTACGIETMYLLSGESGASNCMQSVPLAVLKPVRRHSPVPQSAIACNPYRLRY